MSEIWYTILIVIGPFAWRRFNTWRIQRKKSEATQRILNNLNSAPHTNGNHQSNDGSHASGSSMPANPMAVDPSTMNVVPPNQELTPLLKCILVCLSLHTLFIISDIVFNPPTNIFTALKVPVTLSVSLLREKIMRASDSTDLPPHLEFLLKRLQSFDARSYYIRFGHQAVTTCTHCTSHYDYLVYYIPKVSTQYLRMAFLMAVMTIKGSGKRKWRRWAIASVVGCWMAEMWTIATMDIIIPRNGLNCEMWHDRIWYMRHVFFLIAPLVLHFLPYTYLPLSPFRPLYPTLGSVETLIMKLRLLDDVRISTQRSETLRERTGHYWSTQAKEAEFARNDPAVKLEAERLGLGYAELPPEGEAADSDEDEMSNPAIRLRILSRGVVAALLHRLETFKPRAPRGPPTTAEAALETSLSGEEGVEIKVEGS
ncbi:hypothetical protein FRC03_008025 [Tulasnella sp. 419]|nr:hypothetical protein FRC03_008025 [Tulasnella sp. 419]